jgi:hypothetical protein
MLKNIKMSSDQEKSNLQTIDQSKISEEKGVETSADIKKNLGQAKTSETGTGNVNFAGSDIGQSQEYITGQRKLNEPELGFGQESEKNLLKSSEGQKEEHHNKKEGIFSKVGHVFSSVFEKTKEIIFPDLSGGKEEATDLGKETEMEGMKAPQMEENITQKEEKKPLEKSMEETFEKPAEFKREVELTKEPLIDEKSKSVPAYIIGEGDNKIVYYRPVEISREETSTSSQKKEKPEESQHNIEQEKLRENLGDLNINKEEQPSPEKPQLKTNQNFYQDISKSLQFGEKGKEQMQGAEPESASQQKIQ